MKGSDTIMEVTKENQQQTLSPLRNKGLFTLISHIENTLKINQEEYEEGSEYGTDKGYGARIFVIQYISEYVTVMKEYNLIGSDAEIEETISEDNGNESYYYLFLTGSDSAIAIYVINED